jgi:hypothetical protein
VISNDTRCAHRELEVRLRPFVARRVPKSDVDDVLQDVFLRAQRALPELRDEERFGTWMYRVARSAIAESHRQRSRHPIADADDAEAPAAIEVGGPTPLESEIAAYLMRSLRGCRRRIARRSRSSSSRASRSRPLPRHWAFHCQARSPGFSADARNCARCSTNVAASA